MRRKVIRANDSLENDAYNAQREADDKRTLKIVKRKMQDLFDTLESTRKNFARDYDLTSFCEELDLAIREIAYALQPFGGVEGSTNIKAASDTIAIPAPFNKYYRVATDADLADYADEDGISPCEDCEGYDAANIGWAIAKDDYIDALADQGLDLVELVTFGDDPEVKLCYAVHDRIYSLDEDEIVDALYDVDAEEEELRILEDSEE